MVGFANFTHQYDYRLGQTPFYQKGAMGQDPLKTFSARSTQEYRANASRIRDMRFANSNELNADTALRSKREQMISSMYSGSKNPELLVGVHGKLNPQYSRSGGALSTGRPYIKMMKGKKGKQRKAVGGGVGGGGGGGVGAGGGGGGVPRSFVAGLLAKQKVADKRAGFQSLDAISQPKGPTAHGYSSNFLHRAQGDLVKKTAANRGGAGGRGGGDGAAGAVRDTVHPKALAQNVTRKNLNSPVPTKKQAMSYLEAASPQNSNRGKKRGGI